MTVYSARADDVMAFDGAMLDPASIGLGLEDAQAFALLERRLIVDGRRARLVDDAVVRWCGRAEAQAHWQKLIRFTDGRALQDYEAAVKPFLSLIGEMRKWRESRRAKARRGQSGVSSRLRLSPRPLPPREHALATMLEPVVERMDANRKAAWRKCLAEGRIVRSVGDVRSAALVAPDEAAPRALARTVRYLFLSDLAHLGVQASKGTRKSRSRRTYARQDEPIIERAVELYRSGKYPSCSHAVAAAIAEVNDLAGGGTIASRQQRIYRYALKRIK